MDPGFLLINNFARLVAILGILISTPLFAWAGYLWMTSMGDPNRAAAARNAFISVGLGLVIIGCAFIIPSVIGESVVAPAGGLVYEQDSGINCDGILREQLVANHQVSNADRINFIILRIQEKFEDCNDLFWTPFARSSSGVISSCFDDPYTRDSISGVTVPRGLKKGGSEVGNHSGRDARNNIIVHWTVPCRVSRSGVFPPTMPSAGCTSVPRGPGLRATCDSPSVRCPGHVHDVVFPETQKNGLTKLS